MPSPTTTTAFIVMAALVAPALAQIDWIQQSPYPADVDLHAVYFVTPDHGFISGADDLLMETLDGGETWAQVASVGRNPQFHEDPIWDIQFIDDQHGFAAGNTVFRTTDGGETWQNLGSQGSIDGIDFLTPQVGYIWGNLFVLRTTDAGASYTMVWDWQTFDPVSDVDFIDEQHGLLVGVRDDLPGVYETTNGGDTWERISPEPFGRILYLTESVVLASRQSAFYRSTDGGVSWQLMHEEDSEPVNGIETMRLIDDDSIAAIDINARIWISDDAGLTWTRTFGPMGNWGYSWDLRFADASTGYAVGRLGLIYKTTDGGQTWAQISNGAAGQMNDIDMLPSGRGFAVGDTGVILRTTDFGRQWTVSKQPTYSWGIATDLETVQAIDDTTIVAGGDIFIRSNDGGDTWFQMGELPGYCNDLSFLNADEGWAFGSLEPPWGFISRTTDGGETWVRVPEGQLMNPVHEGKVMPSGRGWGLYPQTQHAITNDGFTSWIPRNLPSGDSWQEFDFATDDIGWYGGFFGGVMKSSNGGFIFEAQDLPGFRHGSGADTDRLTDVVAMSASEAYISILKQGAIYDGVIYHTTNGGADWVPLDPIRITTNQFGAAVSEMDILATGEIWAMNSSGFIFASDEPELSTPGDVDGDGLVDFGDLVFILSNWGACPADCPADLDGNGVVALPDLLIVLSNWS